MDNLIDHTFFVGEISIPNTNQQPVQDHLFLLIGQWQKELLRELLGDDLYSEFEDGLKDKPILSKWNDLKNKIVHEDISMIAYMVFFRYMEATITQTSGVGENLQKSENGTRIQAHRKMVNAWNRMVDEMELFYKFIRENYSTYSNVKFLNHNRYKKINIMGI